MTQTIKTMKILDKKAFPEAVLQLNISNRYVNILTDEVLITIFCYFHRGAVAKDGRIQAGDLILAVNGDSLDGMSNKQAVAILRDAAKQSRFELAAMTSTYAVILSLHKTCYNEAVFAGR